jgi:hypothetical protein
MCFSLEIIIIRSTTGGLGQSHDIALATWARVDPRLLYRQQSHSCPNCATTLLLAYYYSIPRYSLRDYSIWIAQCLLQRKKLVRSEAMDFKTSLRKNPRNRLVQIEIVSVQTTKIATISISFHIIEPTRKATLRNTTTHSVMALFGRLETIPPNGRFWIRRLPQGN